VILVITVFQVTIKMQTTRWNKRRLGISAIGILVFYLIFSASNNRYEADVTIKKADPKAVWDFVADFSKMRVLNPTILDFRITKDHGHSNHWKYTAVYTEQLSHWPHWINEAEADFIVRRLDPMERGQYSVLSEHCTCFLGGLYCLYSTGEFRFSAAGEDTYCIETVQYQCPPFMGLFCRREVEFQRKAIMKNLSLQFSTNS